MAGPMNKYDLELSSSMKQLQWKSFNVVQTGAAPKFVSTIVQFVFIPTQWPILRNNAILLIRCITTFAAKTIGQ